MSTWQTLYVFTDRMTHFSLKMVTSVGDATPVSEAMNTSSGQPNSALHWAYESPPVTVRLALTSTSSTTVRESKRNTSMRVKHSQSWKKNTFSTQVARSTSASVDAINAANITAYPWR